MSQHAVVCLEKHNSAISVTCVHVSLANQAWYNFLSYSNIDLNNHNKTIIVKNKIFQKCSGDKSIFTINCSGINNKLLNVNK